MDRRPIKSRGTAWAQSFARFLAGMSITPNQISVMSVVFSAAAGVAMCFGTCSSHYFYLLGSMGIVLRLLCNLFDGMVAVEHGKATKSGGIYNDAPDRFADIFIVLGAGHAASLFPHAIYISWIAACFAVMTAYVRVLGASNGTDHFFFGPMAKQHRMFLLILGGLIEFVNGFARLFDAGHALYVVVIIIAIGSVFTTLRRLRVIIKTLESED